MMYRRSWNCHLEMAVSKMPAPAKHKEKHGSTKTTRLIPVLNGDKQIATLQILGKNKFCINGVDGAIIFPPTETKKTWYTSLYYRNQIIKAFTNGLKIDKSEAEKITYKMCAEAEKRIFKIGKIKRETKTQKSDITVDNDNVDSKILDGKNIRTLFNRYSVFEEDPKYPDGEKRLVIINLAKMIYQGLDQHFLTLKDSERIYRYKSGYFVSDGRQLIKKLTQQLIGNLTTEQTKGEVVGYIRDKNYQDRDIFDSHLNLINVNNGVYDIETDTLKEHSYKYYFNYKIPVDYEKDAACPLFDKTLEEICMKQGNKRIEIENTIWEYAGYTLYHSTKYKRFILFDGGGDNGKTLVLNAFLGVIGDRNNTSIRLQDLNRGKFAVSKLQGKLGNISDDISDKAMHESSIIKGVTGGTHMFGDEKFNRDGIEFYCYAKPWYSCNKLPEVFDESNAFFGRMILISFLNRFVKKNEYDLVDNITIFKADIELEEKLKKELPGILNGCIKGLQRLLKNNDFSFATGIDEIREEYTKKTHPVHAFIEETCEHSKTCGILKKDFYNAVVNYCIEKGYTRPSSQNNVTRQVNDEPIDITLEKRYVNGKYERIWIGIKSLTNDEINHCFGGSKEERTKIVPVNNDQHDEILKIKGTITLDQMLGDKIDDDYLYKKFDKNTIDEMIKDKKLIKQADGEYICHSPSKKDADADVDAGGNYAI